MTRTPLFISIHQDGRTLYPGSGFQYELGGPTALGSTINIPLPPRTSEEGFLYALKNAALPILREFKPDLIINSAGQDNHYTDPLTEHEFFGPRLRGAHPAAEPAHRRPGGRLLDRGRPCPT